MLGGKKIKGEGDERNERMRRKEKEDREKVEMKKGRRVETAKEKESTKEV